MTGLAVTSPLLREDCPKSLYKLNVFGAAPIACVKNSLHVSFLLRWSITYPKACEGIALVVYSGPVCRSYVQ